MKAYRVDGVRDEHFSATLADAHKQAKYYVSCSCGWQDVRIEEVEVSTDKQALIAALNGYPVYKNTGRVWEFKSPKLGLVQLTLEQLEEA
jgi:hypothetical protein